MTGPTRFQQAIAKKLCSKTTIRIPPGTGKTMNRNRDRSNRQTRVTARDRHKPAPPRWSMTLGTLARWALVALAIAFIAGSLLAQH